MDSSIDCSCNWDKLKENRNVGLIKYIECFRKETPRPYFVQMIGGRVGFKIPPIKAKDYSCSNPDRLIINEGIIIGIDLSDQSCVLKCNHCEFKIDLTTLLTADIGIGRRHRDGYYLKSKDEADYANSLKKEKGNGEIVFYETEGECSAKNYHSYYCVYGGHCHCMFDRIPVEEFRAEILMVETNGDQKQVNEMVREFYIMSRKSLAAKP